MNIPRKGLGDPTRLSNLARRHDFAAVVASAPENIIYCSGLYGGSLMLFNRERPTFVVWTSEGEPTLVAADTGLPVETLIEDVHRYARFSGDPGHALSDVLVDKGLARERIGVEMADLSAGVYRVLAQRLPDVQFADGTPVLEELRMVKTSTEMEVLARAARAAESVIEEAFDEFSLGETEKALADKMIAGISVRGAEMVPPIALASGNRTWGINPLPSPDVKIQPGDLIRVDLKGTFSGYQADVARNAVAGSASQRQKDIYNRIVEIEREAIEKVAPGRRACDVYEVITLAYERAGLSMIWGTFGHGIGLRIHERPFISHLDTRELEPGMVLCLEPGYVEVDGEGYNVEDLVLVTAEGHQLLTERRGVDELRELG